MVILLTSVVKATSSKRFDSPTYVTSAPGVPGVVVVEQAGKEAWYRLLEPVRQYAAERLSASGEEKAEFILRAALTRAYALPEMGEEEWAFSEAYVRCAFEPVSTRGRLGRS